MTDLPLTPGPAVSPPHGADNAAVVRWYHRLTKHHLRRYAPGPGYLDWATQPDPFRTFAGAPTVPLPLMRSPFHTARASLVAAMSHLPMGQ